MYGFSRSFDKPSGKTEKFLESLMSGDFYKDLHKYGKLGVNALSAATPKDTGETASSWDYRVGEEGGSYYIEWFNTHSEGGSPVALLIQMGHGTGTGGYVAGVDYINPAMAPIFDKIVADITRQVSNG